MTTSEYVVIGAGLAGAATAWQLARGGHEVTLVEREPAGSARRQLPWLGPDLPVRLPIRRSTPDWSSTPRHSGMSWKHCPGGN